MIAWHTDGPEGIKSQNVAIATLRHLNGIKL